MSCVIDFATYSLGTDSPKIEHLPTVFASVIASLENVERCGIDGTPATPPLFFFVLGKAPNLFGGTLNDLVFFTHQKSSPRLARHQWSPFDDMQNRLNLANSPQFGQHVKSPPI